jgi:hypothetical protein
LASPRKVESAPRGCPARNRRESERGTPREDGLWQSNSFLGPER